MRAEIISVIPGSIGAELGINIGDSLISVNGVVPQDLLDYRYLTADECINVEIEKINHQREFLDIEKEADDDLGLVFAQDTFNGMKRCKNKCIFCFVDQMPPNLRESLYIKDDDYRLSLLYGNFITLTNLKEEDFQRIEKMHISPIYISVHTIDPELRKKMLNNPQAGDVIKAIARLAEAGIEMHTQIVLCPGINDGLYLDDTISALKDYWPQVRSVAVVPVGITKYQRNSVLRPFSPLEAMGIVKVIDSWQHKFMSEKGTNFVFLADELYLLAGEEIPSYNHYEGFPQIENGVGLVRYLWDDFQKASRILPHTSRTSREITFVTGLSGGTVLHPIGQRLNMIKNIHVNIIQLTNNFFGNTVTVAGLLTAYDLITGLKEWRQKQSGIPEIYIASNMLKFEEEVFLDNMTVSQTEDILKCKINVLEPSGKSIVHAVKRLAG